MLLDHGIPHQLAMEVISFAREQHLHVNAYRDDLLLVEHDTPEGREYAHHSGLAPNIVPDLDQAMGPTTPKLVIVAPESQIDELLPVARERWRGRLFVATSLPTYLEMTLPDADKGTALKFLSELLACPKLRRSRPATAATTSRCWPGRAWRWRWRARRPRCWTPPTGLSRRPEQEASPNC